MEPKRIPLSQRIKRRQHIDVARIQDMLVETLFRIFPESVLHGGTAIWRCYSGSRFSEDIDAYLKKDEGNIERLFAELNKNGFIIMKKRIKENSLYSKLVLNGVEMSFEAVFANIKGVVKEYETYEGLLLNIYTLLPEDLIIEKVNAYRKRRKIRDLYDTFFLLRHVKDPQKIIPKLKELLDNFEKPLDEADLRSLIIVGISPKTEDMLEYIRRWVR